MGGKALKFPKRKKYTPSEDKKVEGKKDISVEEHEKRLKVLREMGLVK